MPEIPESDTAFSTLLKKHHIGDGGIKPKTPRDINHMYSLTQQVCLKAQNTAPANNNNNQIFHFLHCANEEVYITNNFENIKMEHTPTS